MLAFAAALAVAAPAAPAGSSCLNATAQDDIPVAFSGRLERHVFSGPPNYGEGPHDSRETAYILVLDRPICINDGGEFDNPRTPFRRVHIYTNRDALWPRLRAAVGHRIRISGQGFAAFTAHHREPLVVEVTALSRAGR